MNFGKMLMNNYKKEWIGFDKKAVYKIIDFNNTQIEIDIENLSASYKDGFLEIKLPKRSGTTVKMLDIEIE